MSNYPLKILSDKELDVLYQLFRMNEANLSKLDKEISKVLLPVNGIMQNGLSYQDFLFKIAKKRNISIPVSLSIPEKEKFLFKEIFKDNFKNLTQQEKQNLEAELTKQAQKEGFNNAEIASISSLATIGAAQLSGFGVYLLASSTVGAITSFVGITLPFAFYTSMSSVISFAIGPAGFLLAAIPLYKSLKDVKSMKDLRGKGLEYLNGAKIVVNGNYELAEMILSYFASMRILKEQAYNHKIEEVKRKVKLTREILGRQQEYLRAEKDKEKVLLAGKLLLKNELLKLQHNTKTKENKLQLEKEIVIIEEKIKQQQHFLKAKEKDISIENSKIAKFNAEIDDILFAKIELLK